MKHIVQEVVLVIIITVISVTVALLIANSVNSEPLRMKGDQLNTYSKTKNNVHSFNSRKVRITEIKLEKKL